MSSLNSLILISGAVCWEFCPYLFKFKIYTALQLGEKLAGSCPLEANLMHNGPHPPTVFICALSAATPLPFCAVTRSDTTSRCENMRQNDSAKLHIPTVKIFSGEILTTKFFFTFSNDTSLRQIVLIYNSMRLSLLWLLPSVIEIQG